MRAAMVISPPPELPAVLADAVDMGNQQHEEEEEQNGAKKPARR